MTEDIDKNEMFTVAVSNSAVINTAFTKTVAEEKWSQHFKTKLKNNYVAQLESFSSETVLNVE